MKLDGSTILATGGVMAAPMAALGLQGPALAMVFASCCATFAVAALDLRDDWRMARARKSAAKWSPVGENPQNVRRIAGERKVA